MHGEHTAHLRPPQPLLTKRRCAQVNLRFADTKQYPHKFADGVVPYCFDSNMDQGRIEAFSGALDVVRPQLDGCLSFTQVSLSYTYRLAFDRVLSTFPGVGG